MKRSEPTVRASHFFTSMTFSSVALSVKPEASSRTVVLITPCSRSFALRKIPSMTLSMRALLLASAAGASCAAGFGASAAGCDAACAGALSFLLQERTPVIVKAAKETAAIERVTLFI